MKELKKLSLHFDSVIIDPPRRKVMLEIYSKSFLSELAPFIKKGALVSVYSPEGTMKQFRQSMAKVDSIFEETGYFKYLPKASKSDDIKIFQRLK